MNEREQVANTRGESMGFHEKKTQRKSPFITPERDTAMVRPTSPCF